jgi:phage-related protein
MPDRELVWLGGEIKTPPSSTQARRTAGYLLRLVQDGVVLSMPTSRPMPGIGPRCHELRIRDAAMNLSWCIIYRIDDDAVVIGDVFAKKTQKTPQKCIDACRRRFDWYDNSSQ